MDQCGESCNRPRTGRRALPQLRWAGLRLVSAFADSTRSDSRRVMETRDHRVKYRRPRYRGGSWMPGNFSTIAGRQRAVSAQAGHIVVGNSLEHFEAILIEAGTAVLEDYFIFDDDIARWTVAVPIMVVPQGATIVKTVAMAALAAVHWNDSSDSAIWAVDEVHVEEDTGTRQLFLVPNIAVGGEECSMGRIAYHITIFIQGRKYIGTPASLVE